MKTYRKKLIEVAIPLEAINTASAREKAIRHGHPSTLHLWWARRPLATCRAILFASLVDDPASDPMFAGDEDIEASKRAELFNLIEELVQWDNSNNARVIDKARAEIARCIASRKIETEEFKNDHEVAAKTTAHDIKHMLAPPAAVNAFLAAHAPPVLDPFCGGGSIPLEAQRLGLKAYASDLNPVPVLITKALIEIPSRFAGLPPVNPAWHRKSRSQKAATVWPGAMGLAEDVRHYGEWMRTEGDKRIGYLYPRITISNEMVKDTPDLRPYLEQELTAIAWLWARTVTSPSPVYQGIHVPLVRSFWLSKKKGHYAWIEPVIDRKAKTYCFTVHTGTPTTEQRKVIEAGTKLSRGCKFRCILSDEPIPEDHIKSQALAGKLGSCLLAVVAEGRRGRVYIPAHLMPEVEVHRPEDLKGVDTPLANDPRNLWCLGYGFDTFDKLFTDRQLVALTTFSDLVAEARTRVLIAAKDTDLPSDDRSLANGGTGAIAYADAIAIYLALVVSKSADYWSNLCVWRSDPKNLGVGHVFARQALQMIWDYAEANPFSDSSGGWIKNLAWGPKVLDNLPRDGWGKVSQLDATAAIDGVEGPVVSSDPPYYDNISYADLSDFFYVWLRTSLRCIDPTLFSTLSTPKASELVAHPYRFGGDSGKAQAFFEEGLGRVFSNMRRLHCADVPLTLYYAFKQSETEEGEEDDLNGKGDSTFSTGWETMLEGLLRTQFSILGTWPVRTELGNRTIGMGTNALASSIVLVCRPRQENAPIATRREFVATLKRELPESLRYLQRGNIAPVDLAQAAIGPGMAVFTRYSKVMETDGSAMLVRTALGLINQALDEVLAEQEGEFDADTRWALAWFEQFGMEEGPFGVAETLSKAKNTAINGLIEAGVVKARAGKVQLLKRSELPDDWNPTTDKRLTVWEVTQHLIRTVEQKGESAAAALLYQLGGMGEIARDLAYRLYTICERKKWADEALAYNGLVIAWSELSKLALSERTKPGATQTKMFE